MAEQEEIPYYVPLIAPGHEGREGDTGGKNKKKRGQRNKKRRKHKVGETEEANRPKGQRSASS